MIQYVQKGAFGFLASLFEEYGVRCEFGYDPELDLLNEFRKNQRFRVENKSTFDQITDQLSINQKKFHNLGLFNRSPIRKSSLVGNNMNLEAFTKEYNGSTPTGKIQIRKCFFGEVQFAVKVLFDSHEMSDIVEMLYTTQLAGKQLTYTVDYDFGEGMEPIDEVAYMMLMSEIETIGELGTSNLRYMDFSFTISGLFFMPYTSEGGLLERIDLQVHAFNRSIKISADSITPDSLVLEKSFIMKHT